MFQLVKENWKAPMSVMSLNLLVIWDLYINLSGSYFQGINASISISFVSLSVFLRSLTFMIFIFYSVSLPEIKWLMHTEK